MGWIGWIIGGVILLIIIIFVVSNYNSLVSLRNKVKDEWAQIDVQLKRRFDLIPNLVETVKGYAKHEDETLEKVINARNNFTTAKTQEEEIKANNELTSAMQRLFALAESYPDLKANTNFTKLQDELSETENKISYARQFYNDSVMTYKNKLEMFPSNIIASIFGFKEEPFFEASETEKENVKVKFQAWTYICKSFLGDCMKKFIFYIVVIVLSFSFLNVKANTLSSINITASIDELGTMHVEEIWQMRTNKDTEIYKEEYNLGNINITNFQVCDEDRVYTEKSNWNINDSFENKKYKYGINYVSQGLELCWGISEYGNKTYTISYDLENAVFNTEDSQVLYLRLINDLDFPPENFNITISGPEYFQDTLDVWGYGYKGYAYVDNGKIYLSNEENTSLKNGEYVVLLVKFPLNTFNVDENNTYQEYQTFNDVLEKAENCYF